MHYKTAVLVAIQLVINFIIWLLNMCFAVCSYYSVSKLLFIMYICKPMYNFSNACIRKQFTRFDHFDAVVY